MVESGQGQRDQSGPTDGEASGPPPPKRRFGASRIRPRVEISRTPQRAATVQQTEPLGERPIPAEPVDLPFGQPREFAGGRVRLYGCSPGCLIASLVISLLLTCLLTALVNGL